MLILLLAVVLILAVGLALYTPDKSRRRLEARYATPPSRFVEVLGCRIHLRDTGPPGAPALLMLHGFASSLHTWEAWSGALSGQYRMVRFDLPGFALSGPDPTGDYSEGRSLALIEALMDTVGLARATLVGNSMGGGLAFRFAALHPDRVERLVLISPQGLTDPTRSAARPDQGPVRIPFSIRMMRYVLPMPVLRRSLRASYADPRRLTRPVLQRYRDMLLVPGIRPAILSRMTQTTWQDPLPLLRRLPMPVLLLWGSLDRLIPVRQAAAYQAALPQAIYVPLDGAGHVPQEESPEQSLPPLCRFLEATTPSP